MGIITPIFAKCVSPEFTARLVIILILILGYSTLNAQRCGSADQSLSVDYSISPILPRSTIIIPLVFHVIAETGEDDISDAQIKAQIDILNQEFAGMNRRDGHIDSDFLAVRGFANLRFCLAGLDPNNQATSGITRTSTSTPFIAEADASGGRKAIFYDEYQGKSGWPPDQYINIWVGRAQFFGGKASFPDDVPFPEEEGIILDPRFVGNIGSAKDNQPFHLGKTLIHELGHYLNLPHIWGSGPGGSCGDDDGISDTPIQLFPYTGCPTDEPISCDSRDMYINYMDNTDDACILMFTRDQVAVMLQTLQNNRAGLINNGKCPSLISNPKITQSVYLPSHKLIRTTFSGTDGEPIKVLIYDIRGRLMVEESFSAFDEHYLSVDQLITGIYIVYTLLGDEVYQKRVLIY